MSETLNAQDIAKKLQEQLTSLSATVDTHEVSTVDEVGDGIARVSGLKSAMAGELLEFKSSDTGETVFGLAQNLDRDEVGAGVDERRCVLERDAADGADIHGEPGFCAKKQVDRGARCERLGR